MNYYFYTVKISTIEFNSRNFERKTAVKHIIIIHHNISLHITSGHFIIAEPRDYCLHESFNATCRPGSIILMTSAAYGRIHLGRCINGDYNIGCSMDVLTYFDSQCSARETCEISVRNLVDIHPCQRDFMSYLEASYRCIEGQLSLSPCLCECVPLTMFVSL